MPLTDTKIRNAKKTDKPQKFTDSKGLYLEVRPTGAKLWRYRYRIQNRENVFAAGEYCQPPVRETPAQVEERLKAGRYTLEEARLKRAEWRGLVKQGIHPAHRRQEVVAANIADAASSFRVVAEKWIAKKGKDWSPRNRDRIVRVLEAKVYPSIGRLPIKSVSPGHILAIMQRVEEEGAPTVAILIRQWCFRIFNYAIANLLANTNPAAGDIRDAIKAPPTKNHPPLSREDIPNLLASLNGYKGERSTVLALRLLLLTFVRSGELRGAAWKEFDFDLSEWRIPAERMKMRAPHVVPLSTQAVAILKQLRKLTGSGKLLFPNARSPGKHMAATTLNAALVRLGYQNRFSPHGFRATASTMLNEMGFRPDWIERQLAHKGRDPIRGTYNKAEYLHERRKMMQHWADTIDALARADKKVIAGSFGRAA